MSKIKVDQDYFIKHLVERLEVIYKDLSDVDNKLYANDDFRDEWRKIRKSNLAIDDIKDAIE